MPTQHLGWEPELLSSYLHGRWFNQSFLSQVLFSSFIEHNFLLNKWLRGTTHCFMAVAPVA